MKGKKQRTLDSLAEGVMEIILSVILVAIGFVVCLGISRIFSIKMDVFDLDSYILIGIIFLIFLIVVFNVVRKLIKKIKERKQKDKGGLK